MRSTITPEAAAPPFFARSNWFTYGPHDEITGERSRTEQARFATYQGASLRASEFDDECGESWGSVVDANGCEVRSTVS